jgi:transposase
VTSLTKLGGMDRIGALAARNTRRIRVTDADATTVLFGLPGVRVERVEGHAGGIRVVDVVTNEPTAAACPSCGVVSTSVKDYVVTSPKDIPYCEERIVVRWNKIRWRCREDYWERGSFTEVIAQVPARARSTLRLRQQMAKAVGDAARPVAEVAQSSPRPQRPPPRQTPPRPPRSELASRLPPV